MKLVAGVATDVGRVREGNEDAYLVEPPLYAVADGMGGAKAGEVASTVPVPALAVVAPASVLLSMPVWTSRRAHAPFRRDRARTARRNARRIDAQEIREREAFGQAKLFCLRSAAGLVIVGPGISLQPRKSQPIGIPYVIVISFQLAGSRRRARVWC